MNDYELVVLGLILPARKAGRKPNRAFEKQLKKKTKK